jgi:hypothetical protein
MSLVPDNLEEELATVAMIVARDHGVSMLEFHIDVLINRGVASVHYRIGSDQANNTTGPNLSRLVEEFLRRCHWQVESSFLPNPVVKLFLPGAKS